MQQNHLSKVPSTQTCKAPLFPGNAGCAGTDPRRLVQPLRQGDIHPGKALMSAMQQGGCVSGRKPSPCLTCTRVTHPEDCENKKCNDWRQWFLRRWAQIRMDYSQYFMKEAER